MLPIKKGHITHLLLCPTLSSSPELVCYSLDILCHCPLQQRASPPMDRDISTRFSVWKRVKTNTHHAPVPRPSVKWRSVWENESELINWVGKLTSWIIVCECDRKNWSTYSDLIIVTLVLHVLIKLFLWVKLNPSHLQLLPYLQPGNTHLLNIFLWACLQIFNHSI